MHDFEIQSIILGILSSTAVFASILYIFAYSYNISIFNVIVRKLFRKMVLTEIDFEGTKNYFRDILYKYSIAEINYVDDFQINLKKEIIVTLLNLELKGKLKINDNKIEIINKDDTDLKLTEKNVLNSIEDGKVVVSNNFTNTLQENAIKEGIEDGLLRKMSKKEKTINTITFFGFGIIIELILIFILNCNFYVLNNIETYGTVVNIFYIVVAISMLLIIGIAGILIPTFFQYIKSMKNMCDRTIQGSELNKKIESLKKYIKDYSLLDEKKKEDLMLWEEYLIYSVVFMQNKEILKKMSKLIKIKDMPIKSMNIQVKDIIFAFLIFVASILMLILEDITGEPILAIGGLIVFAIILKKFNKD